MTVTRPIHDRHQPKTASIYPYVIVMVRAVLCCAVVPASDLIYSGSSARHLPNLSPNIIVFFIQHSNNSSIL
jgi:hypothetical protein